MLTLKGFTICKLDYDFTIMYFSNPHPPQKPPLIHVHPSEIFCIIIQVKSSAVYYKYILFILHT